MIKSTKDEVEYCLREFKETRNSDVNFTIRVWEQFHGVKESLKLTRLFDIPSQSHIVRLRADFQNNHGLYPPTSWAVAKARGYEENAWRKLLDYPPRSTVLDLRD